jgi:hypothetical protein
MNAKAKLLAELFCDDLVREHAWLDGQDEGELPLEFATGAFEGEASAERLARALEVLDMGAVLAPTLEAAADLARELRAFWTAARLVFQLEPAAMHRFETAPSSQRYERRFSVSGVAELQVIAQREGDGVLIRIFTRSPVLAGSELRVGSLTNALRHLEEGLYTADFYVAEIESAPDLTFQVKLPPAPRLP